MAVQTLTLQEAKAPASVTGDQIRAAVNALGLDDLPFEDIMGIDILPQAITVTVAKRNHAGRMYVEQLDQLAVEKIVIGVRWA